MRFFAVLKPQKPHQKPQLILHAVLICGSETANALACGFDLRFRNRNCFGMRFWNAVPKPQIFGMFFWGGFKNRKNKIGYGFAVLKPQNSSVFLEL